MPLVVETGPLTLHAWDAAWLDGLYAAARSSHDELRRWMPWAHEPADREGLLVVLDLGAARFRADEEWPFVMIENATRDVVGSAGLHRRAGPDALEIGYWVRTDRTRRGYAAAAARALTDLAFARAPVIERVEIVVNHDNAASAAVARSLGYAVVRREHRDEATPEYSGEFDVWSVTRRDWAAS